MLFFYNLFSTRRPMNSASSTWDLSMKCCEEGMHYWSDRKFSDLSHGGVFLSLIFLYPCSACDVGPTHSLISSCLLWWAPWLVNGFNAKMPSTDIQPFPEAFWHQMADSLHCCYYDLPACRSFSPCSPPVLPSSAQWCLFNTDGLSMLTGIAQFPF